MPSLPSQSSPKNSFEERQNLIGHLTELRRCLIRSLAAWFLGTAAALYFSKEIFFLLQRPLLSVLPAGSNFIATSPLEAIVTYLKVAFLAGIFLSSPVILYQIGRFLTPALRQGEKKAAFAFVFFATSFFVGGALFGYLVIFPVGFRFFVAAFEGTGIQFLPQMQDYLSFISRMLLTFGLIFEMPVLIALFGRLGLVTPAMLSKARRYVLVLMFLIAGILTPGPDILSQVMLAVPLLMLYEISVLAVRILGRRKIIPS